MFRGWKADEMTYLKFENFGNVFKYGYLGVDVFFIISGFVIFLSIQKFLIFQFIKSRISRLYPAFWVSVFITFFFSFFWGGNRYNVNLLQLLSNLTMLNGFFGVKHIDGVYWTLLVEMKFYFFVLIYLIFSKYNNKFKNTDYFIFTWLLVSFLYFVLTLFSLEDTILLKALKHLFVLKYSHYFIAGSIFYSIYKKGFSFKYGLSLIITFLLALPWAYDKMIIFEKKFLMDFSFEVIVSFLFLTFLFFYFLVRGKLNFLNSKSFMKIGCLTYPLYLLHQNIGFIIFNNFEGYLNKYILLLLTIIFIGTLSFLINKIVEDKLSIYLQGKMDKLYLRYVTKK